MEVRPIDVAASDWDCTLEEGALRLGFRSITGLSREWAEKLLEALSGGVAPYPRPPPARGGGVAYRLIRCVGSCWSPRAALVLLAEADALRSMKLDRRTALWQVRGLSDIADLPVFADQSVAIPDARLPGMTTANMSSRTTKREEVR